MIRRFLLPALFLALAGVGAAHAQLLPVLPGLPQVGTLTRRVADVPARVGDTLEAARRATIDRLVRDNPDTIVLDPQGFPARAGEVVIDGPDDAAIAAAVDRGYRVIERGDLLGVGFARLAIPRGRSLKAAIGELRKAGIDASADQLHLPSGAAPAAAPIAAGTGTIVGVIDGGVAGAGVARGFATGAPRDNDHATAVASLIAGANGVRGALPGARIASADIYGTDPAGGNATALAKALAWMVATRVPVVTVSLVGPANPLLARVVAAARARGLMIVAAVGNNGPAAPPAFPASYPGVVAVTGVDARGRVLIEAGRSLHLDYAAPGADMVAGSVDGRARRVRGTSFAAPLVAGTIAQFYTAPDAARMAAALARVDATAQDLGARGVDKVYGRGLVCGACRTPPR